MNWRLGRVMVAGAVMSAAALGTTLTSCSGDDAAATGDTDATADVHKEAAIINPGDTGTGVCAPSLPAGYAPAAFVPPVTTNTACSTTQIQMYYDDCFAATSTSSTCTPFVGDPRNADCIGCMETDYSAAAYGAIIGLSNGTAVANISGCIAKTDGDLSASGCAAAVQAAALCEDDACSANCFIDQSSSAALTASFNAYSACERSAGTGVCKDEVAAATCSKDAKYASCKFTSFETYAIGIGDLLCASGDVDAGSDASDDAADGSDDAGDDASDAADD